MSKVVKLQASDGHELDAYVAEPEGKPRAGLVVVQEIFGVNQHIRSVADRFAQRGLLRGGSGALRSRGTQRRLRL